MGDFSELRDFFEMGEFFFALKKLRDLFSSYEN